MTNLPLACYKFRVSKFPFFSHLTYENFNLCLQNTLNMSKMTGVYFGALQITLQMADRSMEQPEGVLEDVLVKVGKLIFPVDFVIMKMEEDI